MVRFVAAAFAVLALCSARLPAQLPAAPTLAGVDELVADALRKWDVPGVAVVIVRRGETVHLKGYGKKKLGDDGPVTPDTLFPLASCTKAFTAAVVASLVDAGRIGWDDPVRKHLPGFHLSDPHANELVTIRDLLSHRTGVGGHDLLWYRAPWPLDESLTRVARLPPTGPFRGGYGYSSLMVAAAGRAAAAAAGVPWEQLVRDRVCKPIGMTAVTFTDEESATVTDRASGHRRGKGGAVEPMPAYDLREPNPAGSMSATARDLAAWLKFHLADGKTAVRETRVPHTVMRLDDPDIGPTYPDTVQASYAMGWVVYDHRGKKVVAHGGILDGFRAQVTLLPDEGVGFVLLNNLHQTRMNLALGNALIDHLLGLPAKDWHAYFQKVGRDEADAKKAAKEARDRSRRADLPPNATAEQFAGEYADAAYGTGKVTVADGKLVWAWGSFRCPLEHCEANTYRVTEGYFEDQRVEFRVVNGKPDALRTMGVVFTRK